MIRRAGLLALVLLLAAGCGLVQHPTSLVARYERGSATLSIPGQPRAVLANIGPWGADFNSDRFASLSWQNDEGWFLQLNGPTSSSFHGLLTIKASRGPRVAALDPSRCSVRYVELTPSRTAGTLTCHDLTWNDASSVENNQPIPGEPPFGLAVEFEAMGNGTVPAAPSAAP